jgi:LacI family transcriptional regulator
LIQSILGMLSEKDMHLTLSQMSDEQFTDSNYLPRILRQHMVDGLLINYTHNFPDHLSDFIHQLKLPAVWINSQLDFDCIYPDEVHAGRIATEYLLELGHRKIQFVEFDGSLHFSRSDRRAGYDQAMVDAGLAPSHITLPTRFPTEVQASPKACDTLEHMMHWLKTASHLPTAVLTHSPWEARVLLYAAAKCGIDVPGDMSIVINGNETFNFMGIAATSTFLSPGDMGIAAVEMLLRKISNPRRRIRAKVLQPKLVEAQTTRAL